MFISKILPKYIQACPEAVSKFGAILHLRNSFPLGGWGGGGSCHYRDPVDRAKKTLFFTLWRETAWRQGLFTAHQLSTLSRYNRGVLSTVGAGSRTGTPVQLYTTSHRYWSTISPFTNWRGLSPIHLSPPPPAKLLRQDQTGAYKNLRTIFASGFSTYK